MTRDSNVSASSLSSEAKQVSRGGRYKWDVLIGTAAAFCSSPIVAVLDIALAEMTAGKSTILQSSKQTIKSIARRPMKFMTGPAFGYTWFVYSFTYSTSNAFDTYFKGKSVLEKEVPKVVGVTVVNNVCSVIKDRAFARMFGTIAPASLPVSAAVTWVLRDASVMIVSFSVPPYLTNALHRSTGLNWDACRVSAQVISPVLGMTIVSYLHPLGYDFYNRRNATMAMRLTLMRSIYLQSFGTHLIRVCPPFIFGPLINVYGRIWAFQGDVD